MAVTRRPNFGRPEMRPKPSCRAFGTSRRLSRDLATGTPGPVAVGDVAGDVGTDDDGPNTPFGTSIRTCVGTWLAVSSPTPSDSCLLPSSLHLSPSPPSIHHSHRGELPLSSLPRSRTPPRSLPDLPPGASSCAQLPKEPSAAPFRSVSLLKCGATAV